MPRVLLALLVALLVSAGPAHAKTTLKKSMWGPVTYDGRSQFPVYEDLGVGLYQMTISWASVAPTRPIDPRNPEDPAYNWPASVDEAIAEGDERGIEVSLMLLFAPPWANGGREPRWAPDRAQDFADFAEAATRRYPGVRHWMIWGEPTKDTNFQPLASDNGRPLKTAKQKAGPRRYAQILDASYARLKAVRRSNLVIGANTFTTGVIRPLHFIRALRLPNGRRPRMDLFGHNPFSLRRPVLNQITLGSGYADFADLDELARLLDRRGFRTPGGRKLRLFLSEYTLPTDHENYEFNFFVSRRTQAKWITDALRVTRRWNRIYTLGYLGLYDDPLQADGRQVERGLITRAGKRKPAYAAFKRG